MERRAGFGLKAGHCLTEPIAQAVHCGGIRGELTVPGFIEPLYPGVSMRVELTVKSTKLRNEEMGEVRWAVTVFNQKDDVVASYDLLTMNAP